MMDKACLIQVQLNDLRMYHRDLFKFRDPFKDLDHSLFIAMNSTFFNANQLFDRGRNFYDDLIEGYAPH